MFPTSYPTSSGVPGAASEKKHSSCLNQWELSSSGWLAVGSAQQNPPLRSVPLGITLLGEPQAPILWTFQHLTQIPSMPGIPSGSSCTFPLKTRLHPNPFAYGSHRGSCAISLLTLKASTWPLPPPHPHPHSISRV